MGEPRVEWQGGERAAVRSEPAEMTECRGRGEARFVLSRDSDSAAVFRNQSERKCFTAAHCPAGSNAPSAPSRPLAAAIPARGGGSSHLSPPVGSSGGEPQAVSSRHSPARSAPPGVRGQDEESEQIMFAALACELCF